jgi:hypothetical protein
METGRNQQQRPKEVTQMKKWIAGVAVGLVALGLVAGGAAFAVFQASAQTETPMAPWGGYGQMMGGRWDGEGEGPMHDYMIAAFADALGLSADDLEARLDAGETLAAIAEAQELTPEQLEMLWLDARQQALEAAVADGVLTPAQADWMLQHMGSRGPNGGCPMLDGDEAFGFGSRGRLGGRFFGQRPAQP